MKKYKGYLYLVLSAAIYGFYGILSRLTAGFGPFSQGAIRAGILCLFILILLLLKKISWKKIQKEDIKWFLLWILPASIQSITTFLAFVHLPVGLVYFLIYSTMITGGILSGKLFFSEKMNIIKILSMALILIGLIFIYKSDITLITSVYVFMALLSGLMVGFWNTLTKKVSNNYSELQMILIDGTFTFLMGACGSFLLKESLPSITINPVSWLWLVVFSFIGLLASFLLVKGFKDVQAQIGSLILPLELVFSSIFGYIFLNEVLSLNVYFGGFLILIAALVQTLEPLQS